MLAEDAIKAAVKDWKEKQASVTSTAAKATSTTKQAVA
jgi:hypothetical protein